MINAVFVDDDRDVEELIKTVARNQRVNVEVFRDGTTALRHLNQPDTRTDVVILDLRLPTLDGLTIAEEIRRNEEIHLIKGPVKLAFLTGADITGAVERVAERVGVEKIFQKPYDYAELFKEIRGWFPLGAAR